MDFTSLRKIAFSWLTEHLMDEYSQSQTKWAETGVETGVNSVVKLSEVECNTVYCSEIEFNAVRFSTL